MDMLGEVTHAARNAFLGVREGKRYALVDSMSIGASITMSACLLFISRVLSWSETMTATTPSRTLSDAFLFQVKKLEQFVTQIEAMPSLLNVPQLKFFKVLNARASLMH